jgi:signal transduction histidine kinase
VPDNSQTSREGSESNPYASLQRAIEAVSSEHSPQSIQQAIVRGAVEMAHAHFALLFMPSDGTSDLTLVASQGFDTTQSEQLKIGPGDAILDAVARSGKAVLADYDGDVGLPNLGQAYARSLVVVPLQESGRFHGLLLVARGAAGEESGAALDGQLAIFANHAALALEVTQGDELRQKLAQDKEDFVSIVSHEFKTPLTSIKGFAQLASRRLGPDGDENVLQALQIIDSQATRLAKLATDLTFYSRLESGRIDMRREPNDIASIVRSCVDNVSTSAAGHTFVLDLPERLPTVLLDRERLQQVVINLLHNAVKYSPEGGEVRVNVKQGEDGQVELAVQDHGIGMTPEEQKSVFKRFNRSFRAAAITEGSGLGLAIAKSVVKAHGGRIWVESEPDKGSTFHLTLPVAR